MSDMNVPMVVFSGGEIGQEALARIDLDIYPTTADTIENILILLQGPMIKAPGTEYVGALPDNTAAIVRPFVYNIDETRTLQLRDSEMRIVDGDAYVALTGAAATIGTPVDNTSTGASSVGVVGQVVTFTCAASGEARAYWPITSGVNGSPTTFRFEVQRRAIKVRIGTTSSAEDILSELTFEPGLHTITFTPTNATYYFRARLATEGAAILTGLTRIAAGSLALTTPWLAADLFQLKMEQSNDVVWFYHPSYRTRVLERLGDTSWSLRFFRPATGPFERQNTTTTTLTPGALLGSTSLTSSVALFTAQSVGQLFELVHQGQTELLSATAVDQASDPIRVTSTDASRIFSLTITGTFVGSVKLQKSAGNTIDWQDVTTYSATASATVDDELDNQIIYYRFLCSAYTSGTIVCRLTYAGGTTTGRAEIVAYTSPTVVTIEVLEAFGAVTATTLWSEGSWSDVLGWPAAGTIDEGRHALIRNDRFWAGESDDYEAFTIGVDDADAISKRLGTGDVNEGRWIEAGEQLVIGTSGAEIRISSNTFEDAVTPLNAKAKAFGDEGSANTQAVKCGTRIVFVDRTRSRLVQCYFNEETAKLDTDDLSRLHKKIAGEIAEGSGDGWVEIAYQKRPEPRLWGVRSDGQLGVMLYAPKEGVYGWQRITAANGGLFKSVSVVPGAPEDRVHVIVEREIDGNTVTYHERFALQNFTVETDAATLARTAPAAWRLQCALSSDGAATTAFGGLGHLEGETVSVWGDGRYGGDYVVTGGSITTTAAFEYVIIGLNYIGKWRSSKLAYGARQGTALTQQKRVNRLGVCVLDTPVGALSYGRTFTDATDKLAGEFVDGMIMDAPVTLWSNEENQPFEGETSIDSRICIVMNTPAPVCILALVPSMTLDEQT